MKAYKPFIIVFGSFVFLMVFLPIFSFEGYSILANTTSHLGAQQAPLNWLMNAGFIALGIYTLSYGRVKTTNYPIARVIIYIFGVSLIMVALFRHRPMTGEEGNLTVDLIHSIFATTIGFSFSLYAVVMIFIFVKRNDKILAFMVAAIAILVPLGMQAWPSFQGLLQRFMFLLAFSWLIYSFYTLDQLDKN